MKSFALVLSIISSTVVFAVSLSDYKPFEYKVSFTNPVCDAYEYDKPIKSQSGDLLKSVPKNVYCKRGDKKASAERPNSPLRNLLEWINDDETKEVFLAYLSYSSSDVKNALCDAMKDRGLKVTLVYDSNNDKAEIVKGKKTYPRRGMIDELKSCGKSKIKVHSSGGRGKGKNKNGYAHNKVFIVNPKSKSTIKIAFSSGNMSSGVVTHHENWHFITTNPKSYFAQAHLCLMNGVQKHDQGIREYASYIADCKSKIQTPEEDDIKTFFIPGEGKKARQYIKNAVNRSDIGIDVAAHRFTDRDIIGHMRDLARDGKRVRLVADDDLYWTGFYNIGMGRNMVFEARNVSSLERSGALVKYIQTNAGEAEPTIEAQKKARPQLHHNKFLIFNYNNNDGAVFTGAGNLTKSAFTKNFENFYFINIKTNEVDVYDAFKEQYTYMWDELGTSANDMPVKLVLP